MTRGVRMKELYEIWSTVNEKDFEGELKPIRILTKRNDHRDGYYQYRAHRCGTPIKQEQKRAVIVISDGCWDDEEEFNDYVVEPALIHEMIHQYQAEVLDIEPDHGPTFQEWVEYFKKEYGYESI